MTRCSVPPLSPSGWSSRFFGGLALLAALGLGCDTVAELSIQQRDFRGAVSDGVTNAAACGPDATDVEFRLRFTPVDGDGRAIEPGQVVNQEQIVLNGNFSDRDVQFVNSVLYPIPDVPCSNDGDCDDPFECRSVNPANPSEGRQVCGLEVPLETLQRQLVYNEGAERQYVALAMDHNRRLAGVNEDGNFDSSWSTDPLDQRIAAARLFAISYARTAVRTEAQGCVLSFGGQDVGGVDFLPTPESCFSSDFNEVSARLAPLGVGEEGRRPLWAALRETIEQQLAERDGDRVIVVFTDGDDESSVTADFESVLNLALDHFVRVHVVHLDNPPQPSGEAPAGPLDELARLACATGGSYQYATSPNDLRSMFSVLASTVPSAYEVQGQLIALADPAIDLDPGCYRMAMGVRITLAGQTLTIQFAGDKTDPATNQVIDDRVVVCRRPVPAPAEESE